MEHIPGSYPADTPQATPQATMQQEPNMFAQTASSHPHGILGRHENPEHPRGHQQTDSGVGFGAMSSDPIQLDRAQEPRAQEPRTLPHLEAIGGGTYAAEDALPPINPVPQRSHSPPSQRDTTYTYANPGEEGLLDQRSHSHGNVASGVNTMGTSHQTAVNGQMHDQMLNQRHDQAHDQSTPYWGDLPKAASGGIYNTVMGHGSPKDDHDQHHNLAERGTGIYNTVAGHGSQDEESKRHGSHSSAGVAPLPEIKEDRPVEFAESRTERSGHAHSSFVHDTNVPDSSLSGSSARNTDMKTAGIIGETAKPSTVESGPRAFPLVSGPEKTDSRRDGVTDNINRHPGESSTKDHALLAAAGGAATAAALSQKDKPSKLKKRQGSPDEEIRGRSEDGRGAEAAIIGGSLPYRSKTEEHKSRSKSRSKSKSKSDESSPARKHSILGIFHRRKGSKDEAEDHRKDDAEHHSHHKKEASAAAAGAGTYGLMHHYKDKDTTKTTTEEPTTQPKHHHFSKPANETATSQVQPQNTTHTGIAGAAIPRVPTKSEKRRSISPRTSDAMVNETEARAPTTRDAGYDAPVSQTGPTHNNHRRSGSDTMKYAGAGAAAGAGVGLGANLFARDHRGSEPSTGELVFEHPREPPSTPFNPAQAAGAQTGNHSSSPPRAAPIRQSEEVTVHPRDHNTLPSGTASGVKTAGAAGTVGTVAGVGHRGSGSHADNGQYHAAPSRTTPGVNTGTGFGVMGTHAQPSGKAVGSHEVAQPGEYNVLPSGTTSGVKSDIISSPKRQSASYVAPTSSAIPESSEEEYNVLPSGTPSGVKVKPRSQRTSNAGSSEDHHTARNALLASGAAAGLAGAHHHHREKSQPDSTQSTNYTLPPQPMVTRDTSLGDEYPKVFQSQNSQSQYPSSSQMAQGMSPAVLPDSYRAQSHTAPAGAIPSGVIEPHHSREPTLDSSSSSNYSREPVSRSHAVDPALAAATGAWAASTGRSSGAPQKPIVVHKCEHCGHDSDVSSAFTKENIEKMSHTYGAGNWFQNAWSHA